MLSKSILRQHFERHMIQNGDHTAFQMGDSDTVARLHAKLSEDLANSRPLNPSVQGRRLNNFCIGSDPEFVFVSPGSSRKTAAHELGLKPGLAAGCDQNQRLAELRGWPTSSVVEHVAGIMSALRWMYRVYPNTQNYQWRAGAWYDADGLGGHVHFGRKRPNRDMEVLALDGMAQVFRTSGFFDNAGWDKRQEGDARHQQYGMFGDIRVQLHGYEYRTLPSWLCSPVKAFVVGTASKLAVMDPEMTAPWRNRRIEGLEPGIQLLQRFARYYAGRDDDAWILKHLLMNRGFRLEANQWSKPAKDFKLNWGFGKILTPPALTVSNILPAVIQPHVSEIVEMNEHLTSMETLGFAEVEPTFKNTLPAKGYYWMYDGAFNGIQYAGAGDLMHNLVGHINHPVHIQFANGMGISQSIYNRWDLETRAQFKRVFPRFTFINGNRDMITFDRNSMGVPGITTLRDFLLKWGGFPIWKLDEVTDRSFPEYLISSKKKEVKPRKPRIMERMI